jgi:hypothetical protein
VQPNASHPEEVGKRYGEYSSHDEHDPQDVGYPLPNGQQAVLPTRYCLLSSSSSNSANASAYSAS